MVTKLFSFLNLVNGMHMVQYIYIIDACESNINPCKLDKIAEE